MFTRSKRRVVRKPTQIKIIRPAQENGKPAFDISKAKITIVKPESKIKISVEEEDE